MRHRGWILLPALVAAPPSQESLEEYQALAKVMKPLLGLVSWPGSPDRPLRIAILGGAGFGTELDVVMGRATVGGRKVLLKYYSASSLLAEPPEFDVLFIDRGEESRLQAILAKTQKKPILTMGYAEGLARRGVMVNFYLEGNRMRFEINSNRVKEASLTMSSHLMNIARIVEG